MRFYRADAFGKVLRQRVYARFAGVAIAPSIQPLSCTDALSANRGLRRRRYVVHARRQLLGEMHAAVASAPCMRQVFEMHEDGFAQQMLAIGLCLNKEFHFRPQL